MAYYRITALIVIWTFTFNNIVFAASNQINPINIPEEYGTIGDQYQGTSDRQVVILQDAHRYLDAQLNIASILNHLNFKNDITLVGAEGAVSTLPTEEYRSFPIISARNKAALKFLKNGFFNGVEYYSITANKTHKIDGIEDADLFEKNLAEFKTVTERKKSISNSFDTIINIVDNMKNSIYNHRLYQFEKQWELFSDNQLDVMNFCLAIYSLAKDIKLDWTDYPELEKFNSIIALGFIDNPDIISTQKKSLYNRILEKSSTDIIESDKFIHEFIYTFNDLEEENKAYFLLLTAKNLDIDTNKYPAVVNSVKLNSHISKLDYSLLGTELKLVSEQIRSALAVTDEEYQLLRLVSYVKALKHLIELTAIPEEVKLCRDNSLLSFEHLIKKNSGDNDYNLFINALQELPVNKALTFYSDTHSREVLLTDNILSLMNKKHESKAVMVVGGFHTEGIKAELKNQGISYTTVLPNISDNLTSLPYEEKITGYLFNNYKIKNNTITIAATEYYPGIMKDFFSQAKAELSNQTINLINSLTGLVTDEFLKMNPDELQKQIAESIYERCHKISSAIIKKEKANLKFPDTFLHLLHGARNSTIVALVASFFVNYGINLFFNIPYLASLIGSFIVISSPAWFFILMDSTTKKYWDADSVTEIQNELKTQYESLLQTVQDLSAQTGLMFNQQIEDIETMLWLIDSMPVDNSAFISDSLLFVPTLDVYFLRNSGCMDYLNQARKTFNTPIFVSNDIVSREPHRLASVIDELASLPSDIRFPNSIIMRKHQATHHVLGVADKDYLILNLKKNKDYTKIFMHELIGHNFFFNFIHNQINSDTNIDPELIDGLLELVQSTIKKDRYLKEAPFYANLDFLDSSIQEALEAQGYTLDKLKEITDTYNQQKSSSHRSLAITNDKRFNGLSINSLRWISLHHPKLFIALIGADMNHLGMDGTSFATSLHEIIAYALVGVSRPAEFNNASFVFDLEKARQIIAQSIYHGWVWSGDKGWISINHPDKLVKFLKSLSDKTVEERYNMIRNNNYFSYMNKYYLDFILPLLNSAIEGTDDDINTVLTDYYFENIVWDEEAQAWQSTAYDGYITGKKDDEGSAFRPDVLKSVNTRLTLIDSSM